MRIAIPVLALACWASTCQIIASTATLAHKSLTNHFGLIYFSGGDFLMGAPAVQPKPWKRSRGDPELPEHRVNLSPFWITKFPVSLHEFCEFLNQTGYQTTRGTASYLHEELRTLSNGTFEQRQGSSTYAASGISHADAERFCAWISTVTKRKCRLPTEAEWEFVAKGGTSNRTFPWGEKLIETRPNPWGSPLGAHPELATPEGVFDMNGPVYQWCQDYYDQDFYRQSSYQNPVCAKKSTRRVCRGGYMHRVFMSGERLFLAPSWKRFAEDGNSTGAGLGFRFVVEPWETLE